MSQKMPTKPFHSVPVLGEDLALDFRAGPTRDIVFMPTRTSDPSAKSVADTRIRRPLSSAA